MVSFTQWSFAPVINARIWPEIAACPLGVTLHSCIRPPAQMALGEKVKAFQGRPGDRSICLRDSPLDPCPSLVCPSPIQTLVRVLSPDQQIGIV